MSRASHTRQTNGIYPWLQTLVSRITEKKYTQEHPSDFDSALCPHLIVIQTNDYTLDHVMGDCPIRIRAYNRAIQHVKFYIQKLQEKMPLRLLTCKSIGTIAGIWKYGSLEEAQGTNTILCCYRCRHFRLVLNYY